MVPHPQKFRLFQQCLKKTPIVAQLTNVPNCYHRMFFAVNTLLLAPPAVLSQGTTLVYTASIDCGQLKHSLVQSFGHHPSSTTKIQSLLASVSCRFWAKLGGLLVATCGGEDRTGGWVVALSPVGRDLGWTLGARSTGLSCNRIGHTILIY